IHMHAIRDDTAGSSVELKIKQRLERAATIENGIDESGDGALLALIFFAAEFHAAVELEREVGVLGDDVAGFRSDCLWRLWKLTRKYRWLLGSSEARRCNLTPDRLNDCAHVLLERSRARRLDLC